VSAVMTPRSLKPHCLNLSRIARQAGIKASTLQMK
jgi:hypothetical protein